MAYRRNPVSRALNVVRAGLRLLRFALKALMDLGRCSEDELYQAFLMRLPGEPGQRRRQEYFTRRFGRCGEGIVMLQGVRILVVENMRVGRNFALAAQVMINATGGFEAGDDVLIGPGTKIWTMNHRFDNPERPVNQQGFEAAPVRIGNDVWIAAQCIILPGVTIGDHSVVGAGSVVTRDVPPWTVVAGNPAKPIRERPRVRKGQTGEQVRKVDGIGRAYDEGTS